MTNNKEWKKNRNLHAICLLDMVLNNKFEAPYNKFSPEGCVPIISKALVKCRLSNKFFENTIFNSSNEPGNMSQGQKDFINQENISGEMKREPNKLKTKK